MGFSRFLLITVLLATTGCSLVPGTSSKVDFSIDNPTDAAISVAVDGQHYQIRAHDEQRVALEPGAHVLSSAALGEVNFIVYAKGRGGLINPTLSEYVLSREIYVTSEEKLKNFGVGNSLMELDGVEFRGPHNKVQTLFIDKTWSLGVHQPFPEQKTVVHVDRTGGKIVSKIFTAGDFIDYVEQSRQTPGAYLRQNPNGYRTPPASLDTALPSLPALTPAFEAHAAPLRAVHARYLQATDLQTQLALQKEAFQVMMDFKPVGAEVEKSPPAAHEQRNQFVYAFNQTLGASAIVVPAPAGS